MKFFIIILLFSCTIFSLSAQDKPQLDNPQLAKPQLSKELLEQLRSAKGGLKNIDEQMLSFLATSYPEECSSFFAYWADTLQVDPKEEREMISSILRCLDVEPNESNKTLFFLTMSEVFELGIRSRMDEKDTKEVGRVLSENVLLRFEHASKRAEDATRSMVVPEVPNALGLTKRQMAGLWVGGIAFTGFLCFVMWKGVTKEAPPTVFNHNENNSEVHGNHLKAPMSQDSKQKNEMESKGPGLMETVIGGVVKLVTGGLG